MSDPDGGDFAASVLEGLSRKPKSLDPKWFYDARGSALFDAICDLEEYYPTRTEAAILRAAAGEIAPLIGPGAILFEPGAGSATKTRLLLDALDAPAAYVPADISSEHLNGTVVRLRQDYPGLRVEPAPLDFTAPIVLPPSLSPAGIETAPITVFFPGSTIGNFAPDAARSLLRRFRAETHARRLLIGVDLIKDEARLVAAYDDRDGVTAAFNLNLLVRINRELGADIDVDGFRHVAVFNAAHSRIEMHLESLKAQTASVAGQQIAFDAGERICTEHSHKYTIDGFHALAASAGWAGGVHWTDPDRLFAVLLYESRRDPEA